ncbi:MAG: prepilin-type N-terminal cleavage/methylation domain-containing protein [Leucobacter sp.]
MLERLKDVLRNRKDNDRGFSLVELAVVIVVIGILVAIAVPVFLGIQGAAKNANIEAAASNGSAIAAAGFANGDSAATIQTELDKLVTQDGNLDSVTLTGDEISNYCVAAVGDGDPASKGPNCGGGGGGGDDD